VSAARLGGACCFGGMLGSDDLSLALEENFMRHGIDVSAAVRVPESRPIQSIVIVAVSDGSRTLFFDASAPTGASVLGPSRELIACSRVLFIDHIGIEGSLRAAKIAREYAVPIVADFEDASHPLFCELLPLVDHLVLS